METKPCRHCEQPFPSRRPNHVTCDRCRGNGSNRWRSLDARRKYYREYAKRFPDRTRNNQLKVRYGITLADYNAILERQGFACAICRCRLPKPGLKVHSCVDHDHTSDRVRGILCPTCNAKLGWFENRRALILAYLTPEAAPAETRTA